MAATRCGGLLLAGRDGDDCLVCPTCPVCPLRRSFPRCRGLLVSSALSGLPEADRDERRNRGSRVCLAVAGGRLVARAEHVHVVDTG